MQHDRIPPSRRTPPPDVVRASISEPASDVAPRPISAPARPPHPPSRNPEFLIIGLFALRLTKRLIENLKYYPGRDADIVWISNFLAPYSLIFALAKISGPRKEDYIATYRNIVSRMKRQPQYPILFMQMNPDRSIQQRMERSEVAREDSRDMTDLERLDLIDFCDAAGEWGSVVPIPAREADRMIELADQRRIADLEEGRPSRDDRQNQEERRR